MDSQRPLARRMAEGEIRLVGSRQFPVGLQGDGGIAPQAGYAAPEPLAQASTLAPLPLPAAGSAPMPALAQSRSQPANAEKVRLSADTLFDFDKAVLRPAGRAQLDQLAARTRGLNLDLILAVGHTDRLGSDAYNQRLSERRAATVKDYLASRGVDADRIYTQGKGERRPLTGNACDGVGPRSELIACLQPDRHVEVEVIGSR
ncbi:OmpA family protein [Pseudothauera rhizosphaerae]|uniref:OmpA family protein n=2 Tax=Pseudothauera rhizosphaerae TaxID=2565932 RepID=A0A4S4AWN2_9RHOO|nr:OmpA family protein [Pseudothauera rhizosphaerae]